MAAMLSNVNSNEFSTCRCDICFPRRNYWPSINEYRVRDFHALHTVRRYQNFTGLYVECHPVSVTRCNGRDRVYPANGEAFCF